LSGLHKKHLLSIPFENLDIHLGRPIILSEDAFYEKIITHKRGGFCYELNGSFEALLTGLGFNVRILSARVAGKSGGFTPEFDHMTLLVTMKGRWLADVGFGDHYRTKTARLFRSTNRQWKSLPYYSQSWREVAVPVGSREESLGASILVQSSPSKAWGFCS